MNAIRTDHDHADGGVVAAGSGPNGNADVCTADGHRPAGEGFETGHCLSVGTFDPRVRVLVHARSRPARLAQAIQ